MHLRWAFERGSVEHILWIMNWIASMKARKCYLNFMSLRKQTTIFFFFACIFFFLCHSQFIIRSHVFTFDNMRREQSMATYQDGMTRPSFWLALNTLPNGTFITANWHIVPPLNHLHISKGCVERTSICCSMKKYHQFSHRIFSYHYIENGQSLPNRLIPCTC